MIWGCFSGNKLGNHVFVPETLKTTGYIDLLSRELDDSITKMQLSTYYFQQDNAPCHKSKTTMAYLEANNIPLMVWPAQSPDLIPIENVWSYIKLKLAEYSPKSKEELKNLISQIWNEIPADFLKKLIDGMHSRCLEVIKA